MIMTVDHLYQIVSIKKKIPNVFIGANAYISFLIAFRTIFSSSTERESVILNLSSQKNLVYICYFSSVLQYIYHLRLHKTWQPKKNNKKYGKDYIGLLGLLQTLRGKQGKPLTGKQGQRDFDQKDIYGL